jgi:hypothetical protein
LKKYRRMKKLLLIIPLLVLSCKKEQPTPEPKTDPIVEDCTCGVVTKVEFYIGQGYTNTFYWMRNDCTNNNSQVNIDEYKLDNPTHDVKEGDYICIGKTW